MENKLKELVKISGVPIMAMAVLYQVLIFFLTIYSREGQQLNHISF
jgi:hypothetical protein